MFKRIFVLTFVGVCLCAVASAANSTAPATTTTTKAGNTTTTARPASTTTVTTTTTTGRPASTTTTARANTTAPRSVSNTTYSYTYPSSTNQHPTGKPIHDEDEHDKPNKDEHDKPNKNIEREVIKVIKLFEKVLKKQSKPSHKHEHENDHKQQGHDQPEFNNTYCTFGLILYTEFRKALDSQSLAPVAQKLGLNVTNSTLLQQSGFAGLIELFSRQHPELNPFYEQCPGQVNKILANYAGQKTNNPGLNFSHVESFPCTAHVGKSAITYNWNNFTHTLQWALSNPANQTAPQNFTLPSNGSVSLQFILDGIDYGYNKIYNNTVITNFATSYWVPQCPSWYNDLIEIFKFSLVQPQPPKGHGGPKPNHGREESSEESSSSSSEESSSSSSEESSSSSSSSEESSEEQRPPRRY